MSGPIILLRGVAEREEKIAEVDNGTPVVRAIDETVSCHRGGDGYAA